MEAGRAYPNEPAKPPEGANVLRVRRLRDGILNLILAIIKRYFLLLAGSLRSIEIKFYLLGRALVFASSDHVPSDQSSRRLDRRRPDGA
ncbi:MAG: hypothetical protein WAL48_04285, partial [Xanthobacteraceae bacterium]